MYIWFYTCEIWYSARLQEVSTENKDKITLLRVKVCLTRDSVQASHRPQGGPLKTALQVRCKKNRRMPMAPAANVAVPTWWQRATCDASGSQRNLQTSDGYGCLIRNEAEIFNGVILHFSHPVSRAFLFQRLTDLQLSTVDQGWCML